MATDNVIHPMKFRQLSVSAPVEEVLRDIAIDFETLDEAAKERAEIVVLIRHGGEQYTMWTSRTLDVLTQVGALAAVQQLLLSKTIGTKDEG